MTAIYLIRHGENDFVGKRLPGWLPGVHLNSRGRAQAEELARALSKVRFKAIYSSPLERAMQTAAPLARSQGLEVIPRPGLGEVKIGKWEGKTLKALRRRKLWPRVQLTPSLARFPGGESFCEAQARVVSEIEALRGEHPGLKEAIACVCHSDIIKLATAYYLGLPLDLFHRLSISPASISLLSIDKGTIRLLRLNDTRAAEIASHE